MRFACLATACLLAPAQDIPRARPMGSAGEAWKEAPFYFIHTELSPATLYHAKKNTLAFFTGLEGYGLGAPTFAACATTAGVRVVRNGEPLPAAMSECWVLVWFAGAKGWDRWDSPWAVFLQKKPSSARLDAGGLAFEFPGPAGTAALLPLYGYFKPPQEGKDFLAQNGLPPKKIQPWTWSKGLPADVLARVRTWAQALREFPIYCRDSFSVDRSKDTVTIRQEFQYLSLDDDWKTPHLRLAPLSPALAHASLDGKFPVQFSRPLKDLDYFTPYGPYIGIEGDAYDATFRVLQYVHEMESPDPPDTKAHPTVQAALDRLRAAGKGKFRDPGRYDYDHGGIGNFCWAILGDLWYAKALPYYDDETRKTALASLRKYFTEDVLVRKRFVEREYPRGSGRTYLILEGPGIGSWGVLGDAGKFSTNLLETLWAYVQFTGDTALVKDPERWAIVKKLFCTPAETKWTTFAREAIAEMGDEAPPCLALARLAHLAGDADLHGYACSLFARELVHHWLKQRGAPYYRQNQPWHTMEPMPEEVYLTNFWGDVASWQIDGPAWPKDHGERQHTNRWVRFKSEDVGRFYRDFLKEDAKKELDLLARRWSENKDQAKRMHVNDSHGMPSMVQLRSLVLNETPAELAKIATPDRFGGPPSGVLGSCLGVIRTSHPTKYKRIIPPAPPTPFVTGLEREVGGPNVCLAQAVLTSRGKGKEPVWPLVTWWGWKTPTGHRWTFGHVTPAREGAPGAIQRVPLNWNTEVVTYPAP